MFVCVVSAAFPILTIPPTSPDVCFTSAQLALCCRVVAGCRCCYYLRSSVCEAISIVLSLITPLFLNSGSADEQRYIGHTYMNLKSHAWNNSVSIKYCSDPMCGKFGRIFAVWVFRISHQNPVKLVMVRKRSRLRVCEGSRSSRTYPYD